MKMKRKEAKGEKKERKQKIAKKEAKIFGR